MQKTFCDRCGTECVHYSGRLYGHITHFTSQGEEVGEDSIKPLDLCKGCTEILCEFGFKITPTSSGLDDIVEEPRTMSSSG